MDHRDHFSRQAANYSNAYRLVEASPEAAVDLIARSCDPIELGQSVFTATLRSERSRQVQSPPLPEGQVIQSPETSPRVSHSSLSPPSIYKTPVRTTNHARRPPTPSPSVTSSTRSTGSRSKTEYILIVADEQDDEPIKEHKLSCRRTGAPFHIITSKTAHDRLWDSGRVKNNPEGRKVLQHPYSATESIVSFEHIMLTWRNPSRDKTHYDTFYLVGAELSADILLGTEDEGQDPANDETLFAQAGPNFDRNTAVSSRPPVAYAPRNHHIPSYHPSSHLYSPSNPVPIEEVLAPFLPRSGGQTVAAPTEVEPGIAPNLNTAGLSTPAVGCSSLGRQTPTRASTPMTSVHQQTSPPESIAVGFSWDKSYTIINIDLDATGEEMFNSIQSKFRRHLRRVLDRHTHFIRFSPTKEADDSPDCVLEIDEATLIGSWPPTAEWLREHKNPNPPHMYALIELDEG